MTEGETADPRLSKDVFGAPIGRHFVLLDKIGSGAMGSVIVARLVSDQRVAIKVLRPELAEDSRFVARFKSAPS